jgi:hypothetical protein
MRSPPAPSLTNNFNLHLVAGLPFYGVASPHAGPLLLPTKVYAMCKPPLIEMLAPVI